jgi:hypothetical protein
MSTLVKILYGDGTTEVAAGPDAVVFSEEGNVITLSRAAFREVMLGWTRLLEREDREVMLGWPRLLEREEEEE